jgi:hypothetical protein
MSDAISPPARAAASLWQRLTRGGRTLWHAADWDAAAPPGWRDAIMTLPVIDRFHAKQGRSIARWTLPGGRLTVYLKRHFVLPRRHGLLAAIWPRAAWSPGGQEWHHLEWARRNGLPVPRAVAAGEFLGPWGRLQSFLAVEELAGMLPLHEAVPLAARTLPPAAFCHWKARLVAEVARVCRRLHGLGHYHKDLYLCHFYTPVGDAASMDGWTGRVWMIDLHRLAGHRVTGLWWQVKDLAQFLYSSDEPGVTARDRLRFWRHYCDGRPTRWQRVLARLVLLRVWNYRRHNRNRKRTRAA